MVCFKGFWHGKCAGAAVATLAFLTLACSGGDSSNVTVSGKVTYTRCALAKNASTGIPSGLATEGSAQAARGVRVRAIEAKDEGTTTYLVASTTYTDEYGNYSLSVEKGVPAFIEVQSIAGTSSTEPIRIVSGTDATIKDTVAADCTLYSLRKALDGTSDTGNSIHATASSGNVTVNFAATSSTPWWIAASPDQTAAKFEALLNTTTKDTTLGISVGSRVLGIIDSIYTFTDVYGDPTPGGSLDLFYRPNMADDTQGSFVDYSDASRYYGALRANANDDAWDESIIFMLCARNALYSHTTVTPYTPPSDQLPLDATGLARKTGLDPIHALIDGMPYGMATSLLQSPYLADTNGSSLVTYRDIRDLTDLNADAYSAPAIAALSWDLLIKANKLSSDTPSAWSSIDTESLRRFFTLKVPVDSDSYPTDTANIYKQLLRLQEGTSSGDTVNLKAIFTDTVLTNTVGTYGLEWPRPSSEDEYFFLQDWGTDPSGAMSALNFNLSSAHVDPVTAAFPNLSKGEIAHAGFLLSKDTLYTVTISAPDLPSGASLELQIRDSSGQYQTITLTNATSISTDVMLDGDPDTLKYIPVHIRLKTDGTITDTAAIPSLGVTVKLTVKTS